jgi:CDP-diglyceride synthetase
MNIWFMVFAVITLIVFIGSVLLASKLRKSHINNHWLQIVGLIFILPVILVLAALKSIDNETLSALLSLILGYFFGMTERGGSISIKNVKIGSFRKQDK